MPFAGIHRLVHRAGELVLVRSVSGDIDDGSHLTLRQLRVREEEIDLRAALRIERALQHAPTP